MDTIAIPFVYLMRMAFVMPSHFRAINIRTSQNSAFPIKTVRYIPVNHDGSDFPKIVNTIRDVNTTVMTSFEVTIRYFR